MNEADTSRIYVEPKLRAAGWETPPHAVASQPIIAQGKIVPQGKKADTWAELKVAVQDAVACHFDDERRPSME
jgi:hypothetical protein